MDNANIEKLTKELMTDSKLNLPDPLFDEMLMNRILFENSRQNDRKLLLLNILIFVGVELIILSVLWILLLYFPGFDYFTNAIKNSMTFIKKTGNLVLQYDYLIFSFIIAGFLDLILNKRVKVSLN
jgi:hypothetical protein